MTLNRVDLYIIGPVSDIPCDNRPKFEEAKRQLIQAGYTVAIPHEFIKRGEKWEHAMWKSVSFMLAVARGVAILDGELSRGSRIELNICIDLYKPIARVSEWVRRATEVPSYKLRKMLQR